MIKLRIDDKEIEAKEGMSLLQVCLDNDIYIPNLCYYKDMVNPPSSCRLCFVEVEGNNSPLTSCSIKVKDEMVVRTNTPRVRKLQKTAFELLLSVHNIECKVCPANKKCELQKIAKFLHVPLKQKRIEYLEREIKIAEEHPFLKYDPYKCVLCGKCVYICTEKYQHPLLSFAKRGLDMIISFYGEIAPDKIPCDNCYACVDICPVAALTKKNDT